MNLVELKTLLEQHSVDDFIEQYLFKLPEHHQYYSHVEKTRTLISSKTNIMTTEITPFLVGSRRFGFRLRANSYKNTQIFTPPELDSDLDIAIVSESIYTKLWNEVCQEYAYSKISELVSNDKFRMLSGRHLQFGWLRTDLLPRTPTCNAIWDVANLLSYEYNPIRVRVAPYYSKNFLFKYQAITVREAKQAVEA